MINNDIIDNIPLRFSQQVIEESKRLIESKQDPQCIDYSKFVVTKESEYSCLSPYAAKQVGDILEAHFKGAENINNILDATAHIGCDTINFRKRFGANCISVEVDPNAYICLVQNQKMLTEETSKREQLQEWYPDDNFSVHCNCIEFIHGFKKKMDFVYFDPPWGGPGYWKQKNIMLFLTFKGQKYPLYTVVNNVFKEGFTKTVVVKIPTNFNIQVFRKRLRKDVKYQLYRVLKPKKKGSKIAHPAFFIAICTVQ